MVLAVDDFRHGRASVRSLTTGVADIPAEHGELRVRCAGGIDERPDRFTGLGLVGLRCERGAPQLDPVDLVEHDHVDAGVEAG